MDEIEKQLLERIKQLENENKQLKETIGDLRLRSYVETCVKLGI